MMAWVDREVREPLQEEGKEGLGVGRRGEAKSDWAGQEDGEGGENICERFKPDICQKPETLTD